MKIFSIFLTVMLFFTSCSTRPYHIYDVDVGNPPMERFPNITFELSLKPFKKNDPAYVEAVCRTIYSQWAPLIKISDTISFMLWTADGSEILEYRGSMKQPLEWGKYIGNPNTKHAVNSGPETLSLHERAYTYMENPPTFTYGDLKYIVTTLKRVGKELTGKPIRVGNTFDPGPEFAISKFKYESHPEICMANTMGAKSFVCCYATLNEDKTKYAGFPGGIPQGTPLGTFLGKQSQVFLTDLGFDFLWLSNGFGFGMEPWSSTGAIFDGKVFHSGEMTDVQQKILNFWTLFRKECPVFRIETRGTNLSAGIDLAGDGVDLRSIYRGGFNLLPPPNSPWAALDGDYGLELIGYMSRMAELPDERYLFRFYTHDPWWANSPWLDRYEREPHDIYLPMSVSRINRKGEIKLPTHLNFLSIDDSYGNMPDQVPNEVIPHILQGRRLAPDQPGQVVWVYPFDEYHNWAYSQPECIGEIFYGDWFIRQALNDGFPMNTVVSTSNFASLMQQGNRIFNGSVLVTIVPEAGSEVEKQLMEFVRHGGSVVVYGTAIHGSKEFLDFMNIRTDKALSGEFELTTFDCYGKTGKPEILKLRHDAKWSGGGIETVVSDTNDPSTKVLVKARLGNAERDIVVIRELMPKSKIIYVRGTNSASYRGGRLLSMDDPEKWFTGGSLMRFALSQLGYSFRYSKLSPSVSNPVNVVSRHDNGFYFAGFAPNQTTEQHIRFPQGAPIFTGMETELKDGYATYRLPKSWSKECRVFVEQNSGMVTCNELAPVEYKIKRKIRITGLKNAAIRFYPGNDETHFKAMTGNNHYPDKPDTPVSVRGSQFPGVYYEYKDITGQIVFTW